MPIPTSIADLSTTAASNSPQGSEPPTEGDNYLRALSAIIKQEHDNLGTASTTSLGAGMVGFLQSGTGAVARTAMEKLREVASVKDFGATGDGSTDDKASIQAAIDAVTGTEPGSSRALFFPSGTYGVSGPVLLPSHILCFGEGMTNTTIKALSSATFSTSQAVVMTAGFAEDADIWDYYSPYPAGLKMGVKIRDLCIDGNRANVANAQGLMIYGGQWQLQNLAVCNTSGHGIWTECGSPISSTSGDDRHDFLNMHEAYADNIYIVNANKHGWLYRGPNDSRIGRVNIKTCGWGAFVQETDSTISVGNLSIDHLHAYSCTCGHANAYMIELATAHARFIYCDSSHKGGVLTTGAVVIGELYGLGNGRVGSVGQGGYWTLKANATVQVAMIRDNGNTNVTSGTLGGSVWINSTECQIAQMRIVESSGTTVAATGVKVDGAMCNIGQGVVENYDMTGGIALQVATSDNMINLLLKGSETGLQYNNSGQSRNQFRLGFNTCTTDIATAAAVGTSDVFQIAGDSGDGTTKYAQANIGRLKLIELSAHPADPISGVAPHVYVKGDKLFAQYNDGGTVRYKYLDLTGTSATWTHTTVAP